MKDFRQLVFDEDVEATGALYTSPTFEDDLARAGALALDVITDTASGTSPTLTVQIEESADRIHWNGKAATPEINAAPISTSQVTTLVRRETGSAPLACYARLRVALGGTSPKAHVRIWATTKSGKQFLPRDIAGCRVWLRGDLGVTSAAKKVSSWANQADTSLLASVDQPTAGERPTHECVLVNGLPGLVFDGTTRLFADFTSDIVQPGQTFAVFYPLSQQQSYVIDGATDATKRWQHITAVTAATGLEVSSGASVTGGTYSTSVPRVWAAEWNGASGKLWQDGTLAASGNIGTAAASGLTIGSSRSSSFYFYGYLSEVIFFDRLLAVSERIAVEGYLGARYGIVMA